MQTWGKDQRQVAWLAGVSIAILIVTGIVFNLYPRLDIEISSRFYIGNLTFLYHGDTWLGQFRHTLMRMYYIWYGFCIFALIYTASKQTNVFKLDVKGWLFQVVCNVVGPGIIANGLIKEFSGRARPRSITEFGRDADFTPVLNWSDQCSSNCSFVSGEASAAFMIFAALLLTTLRYRFLFFVCMLAFGGLVSFMRVGQGGHFTSDCIMAGALMMLVACVVYWVMYLRQPKLAEQA